VTAFGIFRVYFNRHQAAPLVWCVAADHGGWEIAVQHVVFRAPARTAYTPKPEKDEDDGKPSAFVEVYGRLEVEGSIATIHPHEPAA
jgi:hypothetical protein